MKMENKNQTQSQLVFLTLLLLYSVLISTDTEVLSEPKEY